MTSPSYSMLRLHRLRPALAIALACPPQVFDIGPQDRWHCTLRTRLAASETSNPQSRSRKFLRRTGTARARVFQSRHHLRFADEGVGTQNRAGFRFQYSRKLAHHLFVRQWALVV